MAEDAKKPFNPKEHLIDLAPRGAPSRLYLQVRDRLVWFRDVFPDGEIDTELLHFDQDTAVVRATIRTTTGLLARGIASASRGKFPYVMKAETAAIGRALAAAGFGTQFCDDFDEERIAGQPDVVDSPVERSAPAATNGTAPKAEPVSFNPNGLSVAQRKMIFSIAARLSIDAEAECMKHCGKRISELSKREASDFIDALQPKQRDLEGIPQQRVRPEAVRHGNH